ncbi:uncharacterized protein LOC142239813 [Haematobia irritans]|uniref:uncharacterized protein LOC142239813 n=1 Tax=Haematobia irritans TaxID=7368 RepID=UPI003F507636
MAARRKHLFNHGQLDVEQAELERRWSKLTVSFEEIMTGEDEALTNEFGGTATTKYEEASLAYRKCKTKIIEMRKRKSQLKADESLKMETSMTQPGFSSLKLPPCDTHPFEGGYSKWPAFRDIFTAVFSNHPELFPAQKLYHLRSKTRGEAYQIVKKFDLVDENFQLAWDALVTRYENPRILVHQQMKQLFGLPSIQMETPKSIRQIQSGINDSLSIFKSYKINTDNWDPILVHLCSTKLPEDTLRAWEDSLSNHKELPTWLQMSSFLSKRIEIIETISDFRKFERISWTTAKI